MLPIVTFGNASMRSAPRSVEIPDVTPTYLRTTIDLIVCGIGNHARSRRPANSLRNIGKTRAMRSARNAWCRRPAGWITSIPLAILRIAISPPACEIERWQQWVQEVDTLNSAPACEVFNKDRRHLIEPGGGPDLSVKIAELMFAIPSARFQNNQAGLIEDGKCLGKQRGLLEGVVNRQDRVAASDRRTQELCEDLRAEPAKPTGHESVDRLQRPLVLRGL
jgi:hypothetical protein